MNLQLYDSDWNLADSEDFDIVDVGWWVMISGKGVRRTYQIEGDGSLSEYSLVAVGTHKLPG